MAELAFVRNGGSSSYQLSGPFPAGTTITLSWTGVSVDAPCGAFVYAYNAYADGSHLLDFSNFFGAQATPVTRSFVLEAAAAEISGSFWCDSYCSGGTVHGFTSSSTGGPGFCAYGTERNPTVDPIIYVTSAVLLTWLQPFGWQWLLGHLIQLGGITLVADTLCRLGPPPVPTIPANPLEVTSVQARAILDFVAWYSVCRCVPGAPAPIPYPPPTLTAPTDTPALPVFTCDNVDPCAALIRIENAVFFINQSMAQVYELTTVLQRYGLPFESILGARHSQVLGSAAFAVSRLVGMRVEITNLADTHRELEGAPPYIWDLGWMSIGNASGMWIEQRITRLSQQWLPKAMPMATTFGYFLKDGVEAAFTELQAEP